MSETTRSPGSSSEVERGEVPELATLGTMVRSLFITLDISQRQYAHRVHLDPSAVSRYLSGRRVPPRHFVERLISEVESERGGSVTPEVREKIENTWLAALKACNPGEYQLENLRTDLARSRRDTERANRTVEALQLLLEQKESQVREAGRELAGLQADWAADRADAARAGIDAQRERESVTASRDGLLREIESLRSDLRVAESLRADAEEHRRELRARVLQLEADLAERAQTAGDIPLDAFMSQLERLWEEDSFPEAARDLTEAAWRRPPEETLVLVEWLAERGEEEKLITFVSDIGRLRPVQEVLDVAQELVGIVLGYPRFRPGHIIGDGFSSAIASRITARNVNLICRGLRDVSLSNRVSLSDQIFRAALRGAVAPADAVDLIVRSTAESGWKPAIRPVVLAMTLRRDAQLSFPLVVAAGLLDAEQSELAAHIVAQLSFGNLAKVDRRDARLFFEELRKLDAGALDALFELVAAQGQLPVQLAEFLFRGGRGDIELLDRLLDMMERTHGQLLFVSEDLSRPLRLHIARRHD